MRMHCRENRHASGVHGPGRLPVERRAPILMVLNIGKLNAQVSNRMCYQACITDPVGYYKAVQTAVAAAPDPAERAAMAAPD